MHANNEVPRFVEKWILSRLGSEPVFQTVFKCLNDNKRKLAIIYRTPVTYDG